MSQNLKDVITIIDRIKRQLDPNNGMLSNNDKKRYVAELELALYKLEKIKADEGPD